jgi:hypothetical protein
VFDLRSGERLDRHDERAWHNGPGRSQYEHELIFVAGIPLSEHVVIGVGNAQHDSLTRGVQTNGTVEAGNYANGEDTVEHTDIPSARQMLYDGSRSQRNLLRLRLRVQRSTDALKPRGRGCSMLRRSRCNGSR